jgi:DNA processing protein
MNNIIKYWVWLSSVPGVGAVKSRKLLEYFKDIENVWNAKGDELVILPFLSRTDVLNLTDEKIKKNADILLENILKHGIKVVTIESDMYPLCLKNIYDPPIVLYMKGNIKKDEKFIAIVGSRRASSYGIKMAQTIATELSKYGITVVSGMARGIDSYAHKGAIDGGGRTIAVLGCGLDIVYPSENKKLMENIISSGACISEYLPGTSPVPGNFPARNRIISGISLGVIVIEAAERSGSLITADFALEQGREVFALPGNVNNYNSTGTNKLIKEGAKLVTGIDDILEEINISFTEEKIKDFFAQRLKDDELFKGLDNDERKVAECLKLEPLHIDVIARKTGLGIGLVGSILIMLELQGVVEQLSGNIYKLKF